MRSRFCSAFAVLLFAGWLMPLAAQTDASSTPVQNSAASEAEAKLAIALRSFSVLDAELDKLKATNAQLAAEKATLEAKVAEMQAAMPLAAQAVALRDQLRQTQAQAAAYAEENAQLKTKLGLAAPDLTHPTGMMTPTPISTATPPPAPASAPASTQAAPRQHVIVAGDTLTKISQTYYGTPNRWTEILAANRDVLRDEKTLVIGRALVIP